MPLGKSDVIEARLVNALESLCAQGGGSSEGDPVDLVEKKNIPGR